MTGADDGVRISVDGTTILEDPSPLHPYQLLGTDTVLTAGTHTLELIFFENGGHAQIEFMYALGSATNFDPSNFRYTGSSGPSLN